MGKGRALAKASLLSAAAIPICHVAIKFLRKSQSVIRIRARSQWTLGKSRPTVVTAFPNNSDLLLSLFLASSGSDQLVSPTTTTNIIPGNPCNQTTSLRVNRRHCLASAHIWGSLVEIIREPSGVGRGYYPAQWRLSVGWSAKHATMGKSTERYRILWAHSHQRCSVITRHSIHCMNKTSRTSVSTLINTYRASSCTAD